MPILLTGCYEAHVSTEEGISRKVADEFLKKGLKKGETIKEFDWNGNLKAIHSGGKQPYSLGVSKPLIAGGETISATVRLVPPSRMKGVKAFAGFARSAIRGTMQLKFAAHSDELTESGYAIATFGTRTAGSVCIRLTGGTTAHTQKFQGSFNILGGTGLGARVRAKGTVRAVRPVAFSDNWQFAALTNPSLGAPRPIPAACANAGKPAPPPPLSAALDGFAFAPAGTTSLPPGATIYPPNSTISGSVGCGSDNTLYIVVSYHGPSGALFFVSYGTDTGGKGNPPGAKLKPGQDPVLFASAPTNDGYEYQATVVPPPGASGTNTVFTGKITLARSC